jgi:uncharacterized membrane protein YsdA (DUF1294 family)/cold shock CspA family protein
MRIEGSIRSWNDERGFGLIAPTQGGQDIFVHAKAFTASARRPQVGRRVSFEIEQRPDGRKRARKVEPTRVVRTPASRRRGPADWGTATLLAIPAFVVLYVVVALRWDVPHFVAAAYALLSIAAFAVYAGDKSAARSGGWRTSEGMHLIIGVLGGWPGSVLGQQWFRHKTTKISFRRSFWQSVVANVAAFVVLSSPLADAWSHLPR